MYVCVYSVILFRLALDCFVGRINNVSLLLVSSAIKMSASLMRE